MVSNSFYYYNFFPILEHLCRCQPFLNKPITEERAIKLQQEIDAWQHHHRVSSNLEEESDFLTNFITTFTVNCMIPNLGI